MSSPSQARDAASSSQDADEKYARSPEFELVVPAYNEARSLKSIIESAAQSAQAAGFTPGRFKLVVVENGSTDDSAATLTALSATPLGQWFRAVSVNPNRGYGFGLWCGLKTTTAPFVGWSHADMQCHPADAFKGYAMLKAGPPGRRLLVKGSRRGRNPRDAFVTSTFEFLARTLLGEKLREINAQPKVFPHDLLSELEKHEAPPDTFAFDLYVLYRALRANYEIETIPVLFPPRIHGVSKWAATLAGRYRTILGMIGYMWQLRCRERKKR